MPCFAYRALSLFLAAFLLTCLAIPASVAQTSGGGALIGFTQVGSEAQRALEARFDSTLRAENLRAWMKRLTARPHHVGSEASKEKAEFMASRFRDWGFDTEIETFEVLFPTPKERLVELVAPDTFRLKLEEPALPEDATSDVRDDMLPTYNSYSADGDVTAELVYVNQGIPRDYEELEKLGISVEGKIVIARYGGSWRGIKPKVAAEHGAVGCILYSDPRDDGYFQGDVYPEGAFRPGLGAQRGSVSDMPTYPGDPLTPGIGAKEDAERYTVEEAPTIMKIPVLPIGYDDALPLLEALGGPVAPESWRGALPLTYHIGPGPAKVRMKLAFDWKLETAYNVVAKMEGSAYPDEWILRGNHHDAWVFGAADPISGMVALMEEARAVGKLAKTGWRPKRTLVYAGWDAEEPGLLGSTEWAEYHADELDEKAALYLNTDGNGRGFLYAGGSHTLEAFINQVARDVTDPQTDVSVERRARAQRRASGDEEAATRKDLRISPLGSGSDYTPFLQHLGIASLNLGFGGESDGGEYHSIYDSFDHYTRFGDPGFHYGIALTKVAGRVMLRAANADVLPFTFTGFADNVEKYVTEVNNLAETIRQETEAENARIADSVYVLAADPQEPFTAPTPEEPVPYLNLAPLQNALAMLKESAGQYDRALQKRTSSGFDLTQAQFAKLNGLLIQTERAMTREDGLPRRPWFRHQIYAPGFYTGYGVKTLPGVREAIEERQWDEAAEQVDRLAATLENLAAEIDQATDVLASDAQTQ